MAVNKLLVQPIDAEIKGDKRGEAGWRQGEERKQDYQLTGPAGAPWRLRAAVQPQHEGREQNERQTGDLTQTVGRSQEAHMLFLITD